MQDRSCFSKGAWACHPGILVTIIWVHWLWSSPKKTTAPWQLLPGGYDAPCRHAPLEASWSQTFAMAEHPLTKLKQLKVENALAKPLKIKLGFTESKMHRCFELLSSSQTLGKEPLIMPVATPKAHSCWRSWDLVDSRKETWVQIWIGTEQGSGTFSKCPVVLVFFVTAPGTSEFCREEERRIKTESSRWLRLVDSACSKQASCTMYTVDEQPECALRKLTWSWKLKRAKIHARIIICLAAKSYFLRPEITPRSIISGKPLSSFKGSKHYRSSVTALLTSDCNQFFQHRNAVWCKQEDGEAGFSNQAAMFHRESSAPWLSCLWLA